RHTSPDIASSVCYGQSDIDVAANFPEELALIKHKLAEIKPAICFTSPSLRCTKLAQALNSGAVIEDKRLMELDFGDWELRPWDTIPRDAFDHWAHDHVNQAPPNGETFNQLHQRATQFLMEVNANSAQAPIVVVTHGGVIRALLAEALGLTLMNVFRIQIDYCSVTQLLLDEQVTRVGYVNR
ncbi:MAG TPA: alpha-ribazole phosphatase family protein, partial [Methylophilaceae bacterium]|nr:alpha-ribazole phosphatase family protein [Methylophilaceae bacterium]